MPQTTTIETITITWPLKVIAFICGLFVILLMIMGLLSTDWLMAQGWQQGLFRHCIDEDAHTPLPFNIQATPGCYQARDAGYIRAAAVLCVVCLLADIAATVLTGLGLRTQDHCDKNKYYRYAVFCMGGALISLLTALVVYPVFFAAELNLGNRAQWEFGWAYGVGWGAAIFLFGGAVLLLCDKESEEIYYKERKIVQDDVASGAVNASSANAMLNANQRQQQQQNHHYQQAAQQQFYANANSNHHHQLSSLAAQQQQQQAYAGMRSGAQLHA